MLSTLEGKEPTMNMGQTRWYKKINPQATYVVALDPAMGTGGDAAAIQVFELPSFEQVAEWKHNMTAIPTSKNFKRNLQLHQRRMQQYNRC